MSQARCIGGYSVGQQDFPGYHEEHEYVRPDGSRYLIVSSYGRGTRIVEVEEGEG